MTELEKLKAVLDELGVVYGEYNDGERTYSDHVLHIGGLKLRFEQVTYVETEDNGEFIQRRPQVKKPVEPSVKHRKHMPGAAYYLCAGTVQPYVCCSGPTAIHHFGRAQYERDLPVLPDSVRRQAQPIVDALNAHTMNWETAKRELDKI